MTGCASARPVTTACGGVTRAVDIAVMVIALTLVALAAAAVVTIVAALAVARIKGDDLRSSASLAERSRTVAVGARRRSRRSVVTVGGYDQRGARRMKGRRPRDVAVAGGTPDDQKAGEDHA